VAANVAAARKRCAVGRDQIFRQLGFKVLAWARGAGFNALAEANENGLPSGISLELAEGNGAKS